MEQLRKIAKSSFWQRHLVQLVLGVLAFGMAYALGSFAIDTGSLLQWALALFWIVVGLYEVVHAILPHKPTGSSHAQKGKA